MINKANCIITKKLNKIQFENLIRKIKMCKISTIFLMKRKDIWEKLIIFFE